MGRWEENDPMTIVGRQHRWIDTSYVAPTEGPYTLAFLRKIWPHTQFYFSEDKQTLLVMSVNGFSLVKYFKDGRRWVRAS